MKNVIFISPNFPVNYWQFCHELRCDGVNVLGIGDQPYDELRFELKSSLTEYYKVSSLEDYDQVYRAVAFFIFKYGRIDFLESNNEYWLEQDAHLRSDFNISGGFRVEDVPRIKYKSGMKEYYRRAGIPTARFHMVGDAAGCRAFIKEVGWPVIVKPDNGVGAVATYKLENEEQLDAFLSERDGRFPYIMEEFIDGQINSYDAIIDSRGEPLFETGNITGIAIMDIVNNHDNSLYHILKELPEDTRAFGRAAVKSFGVKSRFVHFEFFRLKRDQHIGKKGQLVALEVNICPQHQRLQDLGGYGGLRPLKDAGGGAPLLCLRRQTGRQAFPLQPRGAGQTLCRADAHDGAPARRAGRGDGQPAVPRGLRHAGGARRLLPGRGGVRVKPQ